MILSIEKLAFLLAILSAPFSYADGQRPDPSNKGKLSKLSKGTYEINGNVVWTVGWGCSARAGMRVWGILDYAGAAHPGTTLFFRYLHDETQVSVKQFVAFPPTPHIGLAGWTSKAPAKIDALKYIGSLEVPGDRTAWIIFTPAPEWKRAAHQPSMRVEVGDATGCVETVDARLRGCL